MDQSNINTEKSKIAPRKNGIINRSSVKTLALDICRRTGKKHERVGADFLDEVEREVASLIAGKVHRNPSKGITLRAVGSNVM